MTVQPEGGRLDRVSGRRTRKTTRGRARGDRGVALVEFAIILPVFMCIVLGMITSGIALSKKINITDAVREGARFGATVDVDPDSAAALTAWETKVKNRIVGLSGDDLAATDLCVKLVKSTNDTVTENAANCFVADPADSLDQYVVRVRGTGTSTLEAFFFSRQINLEAKVAARYERDT
jgi:Flp pilus assembly protein TadG